jgi:flagellar biogenesis protein FliO
MHFFTLIAIHRRPVVTRAHLRNPRAFSPYSKCSLALFIAAFAFVNAGADCHASPALPPIVPATMLFLVDDGADTSEPEQNLQVESNAIDNVIDANETTVVGKSLPAPDDEGRFAGKSLPQPGGSTENTTGDPVSFISGDARSWTLQTLGALGVVIGLVILLKAFLRRLGGPLTRGASPPGVLETLGRYPFGRHNSLVLLRLDQRILLVSQTAQGSSTLAEVTCAEEVASILRCVQDEGGESFSRRIEGLLNPDRGKNRRTEAADAQTSGERANHSASNDSVDEVVDLTSPIPNVRSGITRLLLGRDREARS